MIDPLPLDKPDLYVVSRMLERLWREGDAMLKTRLQVATNVNYDVFRRYLSWMVTKGLVSVAQSDDGHERVGLTPKGEEAYRKIVQWVNEVIHGKTPGT
jgi:predicted transcriptional regulator